mmetsp:Transcript_59703/g.182363  ORF Transcript_59703/g.182363 Transcript_59703/m.182363 type:complete len:136 (-) Transcript_59703:74-481(-)
MDAAFVTANIQAFVAQRPPNAAQRSASLPGLRKQGHGFELTSRPCFERQQLADARRRRGGMVFLDRMATDASRKAALQQVSELRRDPQQRLMLDRAVESLRPAPMSQGPIMAVYDSKCLYDGHQREMKWAPLECY